METISKLRPTTDEMRKYLSEIITAAGVAISILSYLRSLNKEEMAAMYKLRYKLTGDKNYELKYLQMTKSNNWLRTHGYPMRRKIHH